MESKKLGFLIIGISIVLGLIIFNFISTINAQGQAMQCNPTQECQQINSVLGVTHVAVGFLAFVFALGFYLLFFNRSEAEILRQYEGMRSREEDEEKDKFSLMLRPLDDNQRKILKAIREQEGITQSTLRFRTDLSKAKVSEILTDFEKKNLITRKEKGKTYAVFLSENYSR